MIRIEFHPEALLELESARDWYAERSEIAASAFVSDIVSAITDISLRPAAKTRDNEHRFLLKRFPYSIIYRIRESELFVTAFAPQKRRPRYWHKRDESTF